MVRSFRNLVLVLAAAGLTLCAGAVFAQAAPSVVPVNIAPVGPAPGGLQTMATYQATGAGAANGYYTRPVLVSNSTLGGLARGLLRRSVPVAAAIAAVEAAGWAIDELTRQVYAVPPTQPGMTELGMPVWSTSSVAGCPCYVNSSAEALALVQSKDPTGGWTGVRGFDGSANAWVDNTYGYPAMFTLIAAYATQQYQRDASAVPTPGVEPTPQQWGDLVANNPALAQEALRNPDGSVNRNPDVMAGADALAQELAAANPLPDPTAEWDTGQQGGQPQPQGQTSLEFPNFCAWASKVCELADWLRDDQTEFDQDNEVPEISPDLSVSWNSGLSGGSCPAPMVVDAMGTDVEFSYQPLCDAASYIRPIVLAGAALLCVFIIGGFRRAS